MQENIKLKCPRCGQDISLNELLNHNEEAFKELINSRVQEKLNIELNKAKEEINIKKELELKSKLAEMENKFINEQQSITNNYAKKETEFKEIIHNKEMELNKTIIELQNQIRSLKDDKDNTIKLATAQIENIKNEEISKLNGKIQEQFSKLQIEEKNKEIEVTNAISKVKEEYITKINELELANATNRLIHSKSKGENFEHEVEGELRKAFGYLDQIEKITTGDKKADYLQVVKNQNNIEIGKIVYEVKNAKWSDAWLPKLAQDVANNNTKYGILVATSFNDKYHEVPFVRSDEYENIFISDPESFIFVGQMIRKLIEVETQLKEKEKIWREGQNDEIIKAYEKQVEAVKEFMISDLPNFIKVFKKQLEDIESVRGSLEKNANKLAKSINMLQTKFNKEIKDKLAKITEIKVIEDEE